MSGDGTSILDRQNESECIRVLVKKAERYRVLFWSLPSFLCVGSSYLAMIYRYNHLIRLKLLDIFVDQLVWLKLQNLRHFAADPSKTWLLQRQ